MFWGDTSYAVIHRDYSEFTRNVVTKFLEGKKLAIADFINYCSVDEYEKYLHDSRNFIFEIDSFIKSSNLQQELCGYVSDKFESTQFKIELINAEKRLIVAEEVADAILQF